MQNTVTNNDVPDDIDTDTFGTTSKRQEQEIMRALVAAEQGEFYASHDVAMDNTSYEALLIKEGDECDIELANVASKLLMAQKEEYLLHRKHSIMIHPNQPTNIVALSPNLPMPVLTSLTIEYEKAQERVYNATQANEAWEKLKTYQVFCCALI